MKRPGKPVQYTLAQEVGVMLRMRLALGWAALAVVGMLLWTSPRMAQAEPPPFSGCPTICEEVDCWNPQEGWCLGHCNTLCEVCG